MARRWSTLRTPQPSRCGCRYSGIGWSRHWAIRWPCTSAPPTQIPGPSGSDSRTDQQEIALKADPHVQLKLLDVQALDAKLDAVRHQLASIPEATALAELMRGRSDVDDAARDAKILVADLTDEQSRADA